MRQVIRATILSATILLLSCGSDKATENPLSSTDGNPHFFFLYQTGHDVLESSSQVAGYYSKLLALNKGCDTLDGELYRVQGIDSLCNIPVMFETPDLEWRNYCFPETPGVHVVLLERDNVGLFWNEPLAMQ